MATSRNPFFDSGVQASLETAIRSKDLVEVSNLIAAGVDVNARGKQDATPLMIAVDTQNLDAVNALLRAGANPNAKAIDDNGPVSLAIRSYLAKPHGRDIMIAILRGGGDPNTRQPDGDPVLMRFILDRNAANLALMKSFGADLDILNRGGFPLICGVAMAQDWDQVWALIELGARFDYENGQSSRPISDAMSLKYPSPDSPLYPYKLKVWQLMKDKGLPVKPLRQ